ncbi:MAG: tetratricopeptide repeat protein, partial [Anaerolineae bacterium]
MSERVSPSEPAGYLEAILTSAHPLMVEAFYLASVPQWYNLALLEAMRQRDDGRGPGLVERLARYSFISPLGDDGDMAAAYFVHAGERDLLQQRWLAEDAEAFRAAHRQALAFWEAHPDPNYFARAQNRLYHLLIVDPDTGIDYLVDRFRTYRNDRHLPAIERLLDTAREAGAYLARLADPAAVTLDDLLEYLGARLDQLCGQWSAAEETLQAMQGRGLDLDARLGPYVQRALANGQAYQGHYAQAIEGLEKALELFDSQLAASDETGILAAERGYTLIALGDAYAGLAASAGGYHDREPRKPGFWYRLREVAYFLLNLPLVIYLSVALGRRVWNPRFWPALIGLDWIIARLFATGARYYRQADKILEAHGEPSEGVVADEKLAYLYLRLGDVQGAARLFARLLAEVEAPLGPYRQASVRVGLGEAYLQLGQPEQALALLQAAIPVLASYGDRLRRARARELLAEALLITGEQAEALGHLDTAWRAYQQEEQWIDATRIAEHLEQRLQAGELGEKVKARARAIIDGLQKRRYPGRYRHPVLVRFRQLMVALLPLILILAPLWAIHLDSGMAVAPEIRFRPSPVVVVQNDEPVLNLQLSQGMEIADVYVVVISSTLLWFAAALVLAYLLFSLLLGLAAILLTPLATVETRERGATVSVDRRSIEIGQPEDEQSPDPETEATHLPHITLSQLVQANVHLWQHPWEQGSAFGLGTKGEPVVIRGSTTWYDSLRQRTSRLMPAGAQIVDLDYSILRSRMGIVYGLNLLLIVLLGLLAAFARSELILYDLPGTPYSAVDLYPYLYLGLVVPPLWWGVVQPLRQEAQLRPQSHLPLGVLGLGLLLAVAQVLLRFRPLLTVLNLYLPLVTIVVLISAEAAIWRARVDRVRVHAAPLRAATAALVAIVCLLMASVVWRDVRAYHALIQGNTLRDRAWKTSDPAQQASLLDRAIEAYGQAAEVGSQPIWGIDTRLAGQIGAGLPAAEKLTWVSALHSRAALEAESGQYAEAAQSYTQTLSYVTAQDRVYAWRALAYLSQGTRPAGGAGLSVDRSSYKRAIRDLSEAIEQQPDEAVYYVWRGAAYHALGQIARPAGESAQGSISDLNEAFANYQQALEIGKLDYKQRERALTGLGWIAYERGKYAEALRWFRQAIQANDESAEAWLGTGYALYEMERFEETQQIWKKAAELEPQDPTILISLGTVHWKLGGQAGRALGYEPCAEYEQAAGYFERATERDKLWPQTDEDVAFTYRTQAHIEYLLAECPGYKKTDTYEQSIESFGLALALDADQPHYWYRKGRLA